MLFFSQTLLLVLSVGLITTDASLFRKETWKAQQQEQQEQHSPSLRAGLHDFEFLLGRHNDESLQDAAVAAAKRRLGAGENVPENTVPSSDASTERSLEEAQDEVLGGPRVAFIAFTYLGKAKKFHGLIGSALKTYLKNESTYFLVMTHKWESAFGEYCQQHPANCKRLTPIWVDCEESWDGPAPCCKVQQGLLHILDHYGDQYDYFMYMDDDNYIRTHYLKRYLAPLDPSQKFVVGSTGARTLGVSIFGDYKCSREKDFQYPWFQPMIYSKAALQHVAHGFQINGLVTECVSFNLLHDVALQVFNWMYSLPALLLSHADALPDVYDREVANSEEELLGYHGVLNEHHPTEMFVPTKAHEYYSNISEPDTIRYIWHNVTGFQQTKTYREHGDPSTWFHYWYPVDRSECFPEDYTGNRDEDSESDSEEESNSDEESDSDEEDGGKSDSEEEEPSEEEGDSEEEESDESSEEDEYGGQVDQDQWFKNEVKTSKIKAHGGSKSKTEQSSHKSTAKRKQND